MGIGEKTSESLVQLRVTNAREIELTLDVEPWGEQYPMAPGATFEVVARGPAGDCLEVEYGEDHITLYGWPGSTVSVSKAG